MREGISACALVVLLFTVLPDADAWSPPQAGQGNEATVSGQVLVRNKNPYGVAEFSKPSKPLTVTAKINGCKCADCKVDPKKPTCWCCAPQIKTDKDGEFTLSLPPGHYTFSVEGYDGEHSLDLKPGQKKEGLEIRVELSRR
jgi:hypothetical protein